MRPSVLAKKEPFKNARIKNGFTLTSLSKELGFSRKHLSLIENGRAGAGPGLAVKIAKILCVEFDSIWEIQ